MLRHQGPPPAPATYQSTNHQLPTIDQQPTCDRAAIDAIDQEEEGNGYVGGINILVNPMEISLFSLILVVLLDEIQWYVQFLQDEEDAIADLAFQEAEDRWLRYNDYPDHW